MSKEQYTQVLRTRLTDLKNLKIGELSQVLESRPAWLRTAVLRYVIGVIGA